MKAHTCMKTLLLAALGAILASPLSAILTQDQPPMAYRVTEVVRKGEKIIAVGTSVYTVRPVIGSPMHQPAPNVWVYHNFFASLEEANANGCTSLVIVFDGIFVKSLWQVNESLITVITDNPARIPAVLVAPAE
jgi:hypothetical protein